MCRLYGLVRDPNAFREEGQVELRAARQGPEQPSQRCRQSAHNDNAKQEGQAAQGAEQPDMRRLLQTATLVPHHNQDACSKADRDMATVREAVKQR